MRLLEFDLKVDVRRIRRGDGPVRFRQVHLHECGRLPRPADLGHATGSTARVSQHERGRARRRAQSQDRFRVPAIPSARPARCAGQCRTADDLCGRRPRRCAARRRPRALAPRGPWRAPAPPSDAILRRPAAARRHRARARQHAENAAGRRADRRARQPDLGRIDGAVPGAQPRGHDDRGRHARAGCRALCLAARPLPDGRRAERRAGSARPTRRENSTNCTGSRAANSREPPNDPPRRRHVRARCAAAAQAAQCAHHARHHHRRRAR